MCSASSNNWDLRARCLMRRARRWVSVWLEADITFVRFGRFAMAEGSSSSSSRERCIVVLVVVLVK